MGIFFAYTYIYIHEAEWAAMENDYLPPSPLSYPGIWYLVGISRVVSGTWTPLATIVFSHDHFRELPCSARFHFLPALILPSPLLLQSKKPPNPFRERDRERERETTADSRHSIFRCSSNNSGINIDGRKISNENFPPLAVYIFHAVNVDWNPRWKTPGEWQPCKIPILIKYTIYTKICYWSFVNRSFFDNNYTLRSKQSRIIVYYKLLIAPSNFIFQLSDFY